jgi:hypothetical protein
LARAIVQRLAELTRQFSYAGTVLEADSARWLLVVHAIVAAAAVAATTHWCVWLWPFIRGTYKRVPATRRFGIIAMSLYLAAAVGGMLIYPTYKARVKLEFLASSRAVLDDASLRIHAAEEVRARAAGVPPQALDPAAVLSASRDAPEHAEKIARWFDVKEHWVALGLLLGLGTMAALLAWDPRRDGRGPLPFVVLGALSTCAVTWLAAIIGLMTTATRSF